MFPPNEPQRNPWGGVIPQQGGMPPSPSFKQAYPASVLQAGDDYTNIMKKYEDMLNKPSPYSGLTQQFQQYLSQPNLTYNPQAYTRTPELTESFGKLKNLSETGGYSPEELANIRARGVSPIRSVYANAQRNLDRQKSLSGGYSPNYGAASSRMARELSEQVAGQTTNVEAGIAERVASGRQAATPQLAALAERESGLQNEFKRANEQRRLEIERENRTRQLEALTGLSKIGELERGGNLEAIRGMQSLYGTTPALASLFGQQALGAAQLAQQAKGQTTQAGLGLIGNYMRQPTAPVQRSPWGGAVATPGSINLLNKAPKMRGGGLYTNLFGGR